MGSKRPSHSTRPKRAVRPSRHKKLPDLTHTLEAYSQGLSLVKAAHLALQASDGWGPAEVALAKGIEALNQVYSALDLVEGQLFRIRRAKAHQGRR